MTSAQHAEGRQFDPGQVYAMHCFVFATEEISLLLDKCHREFEPRFEPARLCGQGVEGYGAVRGGGVGEGDEPPGAEKGRVARGCQVRCEGATGEADRGLKAGGAKKTRARKLQVMFLASVACPRTP